MPMLRSTEAEPTAGLRASVLRTRIAETDTPAVCVSGLIELRLRPQKGVPGPMQLALGLAHARDVRSQCRMHMIECGGTFEYSRVQCLQVRVFRRLTVATTQLQRQRSQLPLEQIDQSVEDFGREVRGAIGADRFARRLGGR